MAKKTELVPTEKAPQGIIINQITVNKVVRQLLDMGKWKTALQSADMDRWTLLYDLYDEILTDGRLWDAVERRIRAVTSSDLTFQLADGTEVTEIIELIDTQEFEFLLHEILMAIFQRVSLVQLDFSNGFQSFSVPRKHIRPLSKTVAVMQNDVDGSIPYDSLQNIVEVVDKKDKYGLLLRTAPYVIMMRGGIADWAQMVELFGMPKRVGKYSIYDQEARKQLEEAFEQQGAASSMIVPKETDVTTDDATSAVNSSIYKDFMAELKEALLVTCLSNTMTTLNGSSRSQSEVHQDVEDEVNKADMRFVQRILNKKVKPILEARGFKVHGGSFVFPKALKDLKVSELVELSDIIEIPAYYVQEKYGIPEAGANDILARKQAAPAPVIADPNAPSADSIKPEPNPKSTKLSDKEDARNLFEKMLDFFVDARTIGSRANLNDKLTRSTDTSIDLKDGYGIDINVLINRAIRELYDDESKRTELINRNLFDVTYRPLNIAITKELLPAGDQVFIDQFAHNTAVFSAFKNHLQTKEIVSLLVDDAGKLKPFYKFKKEALQVSQKYNVEWLKTEYNQAVRTARVAANLKQWEKTLKLYPNLEYVETTANEPDAQHLTYVGTILPFHHPWWKKHMPPSRWGCQCSVRQSDKEVTPSPDGDYNSPGFDNNVLDTAQFVDVKETAYYKNTETKQHKNILLEVDKLLLAIAKEAKAK